MAKPEGSTTIHDLARHLNVSSTGDFEHLVELERRHNICVVTIQNDIPEDRLDRVVADQLGAARALVGHLASFGHRRIGFLRVKHQGHAGPGQGYGNA